MMSMDKVTGMAKGLQALTITQPKIKMVKLAVLFSLLGTVFFLCLYLVSRTNMYLELAGQVTTIHGQTSHVIKFPSHLSLAANPWSGRSLKPLFDDMRPMTLQSDYDYLQNHITTAGLNVTFMYHYKVSSHKWSAYEAELLRDGPLMDPLLVPNETYTQVHVLDRKNHYRIGNKVRIRIDTYNGYNRPLHRGGDTVFVWVTEKAKQASIAANVKDLRNGSYIGEFPIQWVGFQRIHVSIRYPREILRSYVYVRDVMKSLRYVAAGFMRSGESESTLCLPFPKIPGYSRLCNFSHRNYGLPWYCGHPRKPGLRCSDWRLLRDMEFPKPLPLTFAEEAALLVPLTSPVPRLVHQESTIFVTSGRPKLPPLCNKKNFTYTWTTPAPRGFFVHRTWVPTTCRFPNLPVHAWMSCLANTTIILSGDSNLLMWFHHLKAMIQCQHFKLRSSNAWHTPLTCRRPDIGFIMNWQLHGYPEHPTSTFWADITHFRSACQRIDAIPSRGKYVLLVHLFIHFSIHHQSVFKSRMRCVRRAIKDLLERNPSAKVFIRAPFTASKGWNPVFGGELVLPFFLTILRNEFRGLYDRVILLDMWDITLAGENEDYHPDPWIDKQMAGILLGHICNA